MRLRMGLKPGVGPVMKVMRDNADHPYTTPNTELSKFYFNSENTNLSYLSGDYIFRNLTEANYPHNGVGNGTRNYSLDGKPINQTGWGLISMKHFSSRPTEFGIYGFVTRLGFGTAYVPFADSRLIDADGWTRLVRINVPKRDNEGPASSLMGLSFMANLVANGSAPNAAVNSIPAAFGYTGWGVVLTENSGAYDNRILPPQAGVTVMIWDLPSGSEALPEPVEKNPVKGQKVLRFDKNRAAMARRGYSIDTAQGRELIFDTDNAPIQAVMVGETPLINPGQELFIPNETDYPLGPNMLLDAMLKSENQGVFQRPPTFARDIGQRATAEMWYRVEPTGIRFKCNGNFGFSARYMLYTAGADDYTTGGGKVIRRLPDGHMQIKRPGSSDTNPSYADITLDTRLRTIQILKQAWVPLSAFSRNNQVTGPRWYDIPYDDENGSLFVFPKVMLDCGTVRRQGMNHGYMKRIEASGNTFFVKENSKQSMIIQMNVGSFRIAITPDSSPEAEGSNAPMPIGARYYLLAIPKTL